MARSKGMKVGIVTSVSLDHATPAAFYAHVRSRSQYREIGQRLIGSGFDYFAGGGFLDMPDVAEAAFEAGYIFTRSRAEFAGLRPREGKVIAVNPTLDRNQALPYALDRMSGDGPVEDSKASISLAEFTEKGIELLDNERGFFLMVEGGKIDWACHANDARTAIEEVLALDRAVEEAVDFARSHPSETLIIVTGDHETGGMSLGTASTAYDVHLEKLKVQKISFEEFDREIFPAYRSSHDPAPADIDADLWSVILKYFGMDGNGLSPDKEDDLTEMDIGMLEDAFDKAIHGTSVRTGEEDRLLYDVYNPLSVTLTRILNRKSGIGWNTFSHTAVPLPVFALGAGSESFDGYYDNTDIAGKIAAAMGFPAP
jgi:alkaline phosphatase